MRRSALILAIVSLLSSPQLASATPAAGDITNFGPDLTSQCPIPEGIAVAPNGNVYVSSLNFAGTSGPANICVLDPSGALVHTISVAPGAGGVTKLLGLLFVPGVGLYAGDLGSGRVLLINVDTDLATSVASGFGAPNAFARDNRGNIWVSDSFAGSITKIAPDGTTTAFAYPAQLAPRPDEFPPFGANGIAFDRAESYLYVAVTSRDEIYRIAFDDGALGAISLFATGVAGSALDGADGLAFDVRGNLFVASNQSDEITVLTPSGDVMASIVGAGENVLNTPGSLAFRGRELYITNLGAFHGGPQKLSLLITPYPGAQQ